MVPQTPHHGNPYQEEFDMLTLVALARAIVAVVNTSGAGDVQVGVPCTARAGGPIVGVHPATQSGQVEVRFVQALRV